MQRNRLWFSASCILLGLGLLLPGFSFGASPPGTEKVIHTFAGGNDGKSPYSDLTLDAEGNLYGTTFDGGEPTCRFADEIWNGCGTVFELKRTANGWQEQILFRFNQDGNSSGGALPAAGVIFDKSGNLYGTTEGSPNECGQGNVFKLTPGSNGVWAETVLYSFTCEGGGYNPTSDLVFDDQGDLFGTATDMVFELIPQSDGSWKEVTLHQFNGAPDGLDLSSGVVLDAAGNVYGTTAYGGNGKCTFGCGIVYQLTPGSNNQWTETIIYNFSRGGGFGVNPSSGLVLERTGHLLITTSAGGDGLGTVVELTQSQKGWEQRVLHRFYGNPDGNGPDGKLAITAGVGFDVTYNGGANGLGTVFSLEQLSTGHWIEKVVYSFNGGNDGQNPYTGVVSDSHGHLYGTTASGGSGKGLGCSPEGCGTVYEITP